MQGNLGPGTGQRTGERVNSRRKQAAAGQAAGAEGKVAVARVPRALLRLVGFAAAMLTLPANAQGNLDAGKTPAQIFADTCAACHRNARELKRTSANFLRAHYTTGPVEASAMANYLAGVGTSEPRASQQRQQPSADPSQGPNQASRQSPQPKSAQTPASKKGRPSPDPRPTATILTDARLPELLPELPPPAPPPIWLEPFEE